MTHSSQTTMELTVESNVAPDYELTDEQWNLIADLFPEPSVGPKGGRPAREPRPCFEGILWILRTGARWKDLPAGFPSPVTCWRRLRAWTEAGIWAQACKRLLRKLDRQGQINREESFADGTFSPAKKGGNALAKQNVAKAPRSWYSPTVKACPLEQSFPAPARPK